LHTELWRENFLGNSHSQDRKRTRKDNRKTDVRSVARMRVEGTGGVRSVAVPDSGGHFSLYELHFAQSRCNETVSRNFYRFQEII